MLWLCISLPQLPLEALRAEDAQAASGQAVVVTACEGSTRWLICCNSAAERANLKAAMSYSVALAIHPQVTAVQRKPPSERAALERLAAWSYQFSSTVVPGEIPAELRLSRTAALWLEIGASLKLFGGFRKLIEHLEAELGQLQYTYQLGIAPTLEGAALLARAGMRVAITTPQALQARIRNLPISMLALAPEITQQLHTAGVRIIGLLLELPRAAVARRFGPELSNFLDRLTGAIADPRPLFELPAHYDTRFELEFEVRSTQALLFPLRRLLREFAGFLRARDTGVQHFTLTLAHRDHEDTRLRIGLSAPQRNAEQFFALAREQLDRIGLPAPTTALRLSADEFASPTALQTDLFSGALLQNEDLAHTLERITARLGEDHIHGLQPLADHRPEASWAPIAPQNASGKQATHPHFPERPLWLLPEPKPLQLSAMPQITSGPERIEGGWWDTADLQRDYYILRTSNGAELWIYRDLQSQNWYLHGFWS
jgi:protein ImuB